MSKQFQLSPRSLELEDLRVSLGRCRLHLEKVDSEGDREMYEALIARYETKIAAVIG
jgi:hypothetical protein